MFSLSDLTIARNPDPLIDGGLATFNKHFLGTVLTYYTEKGKPWGNQNSISGLSKLWTFWVIDSNEVTWYTFVFCEDPFS